MQIPHTSISRRSSINDVRLEPAMQVRREPPLGLQRAQEAHHRRGAQRALVDVVPEIWLAPEEAAQVAVVLDALRPVMREEDRRRGELGERAE